jgi:hypothetical protein
MPDLKGHGNEADFLGFVQKLVPHESLTLPFEPFRFDFEFAEIFVIKYRICPNFGHIFDFTQFDQC